jgi:hypothetical protein
MPKHALSYRVETKILFRKKRRRRRFCEYSEFDFICKKKKKSPQHIAV